MKKKINLPVAELHCHIEATVSPEDARRLAKRHNLNISSVFDENGAYKFSTFDEFLTVYDAVSEVVRTPEDYYEITTHYFERMSAKGMIYGELIVSPAHASRFGVSYASLTEAIATAMHDTENSCGIIGRIIVIAVRHYGAEAAVEVANAASASPNSFVTGFGMAGDEAYGDARDFKPAFDIAGSAGLLKTTHAGEILGPESVWQALDLFGVSRIGHGVQSLKDPKLIAELKSREITLEVCPTSNVIIGLFPSIEAHPVRKLHDAGLKITLNSDDPAYFNTDPVEEYLRCARAHNFSRNDLIGFTKNAIAAAFCDDQTKQRLFNKLNIA